MADSPTESRKEDYFLLADLELDGTTVTGIPCKVYLPERILEKPYVVLKPSNQQATSLLGFNYRFSAKVDGRNEAINTTLEASELYISNHQTTHWGAGLTDSTVRCEPEDLHVISAIQPSGRASTHVEFWISPNGFLTPFSSQTSSYTGEVSYKQIGPVPKFKLAEDLEVVFEKRFQSKKLSNGDFLQWRHLAACAEIRGVGARSLFESKARYLSLLDDLMLAASLAEKRRTCCLGWVASDGNSVAKYYRGHYVFPEIEADSGRDFRLVDMRHAEEFIRCAYAKLSADPENIALRSAIHAAIPNESSILETEFLKMFAGLESLVLDFRRRENCEVVLGPEEWSKLKKQLKGCIKKSSNPSPDNDQRASLYRKLDELNRVSLAEAFKAFCLAYSVPLLDLWPVFSEYKKADLAGIRNRLIHGDSFTHEQLDELIVANEHLRLTLERALVCVLGWNVANTEVSPERLAALSKIIDRYPDAQDRLTSKNLANRDQSV